MRERSVTGQDASGVDYTDGSGSDPRITGGSCRVPSGKLLDKKQKYHHVTLKEFHHLDEGAWMVQNLNQ